MQSSSGLTIRHTVSQDGYAPTWDPIGVTFIFKYKCDIVSLIVRPDDDRMTVETCRHS